MGHERLKPGQPAPASGIYKEVTPAGRPTGEEATSTEKHPLPPTSKPGNAWVLKQPAVHNGGR